MKIRIRTIVLLVCLVACTTQAGLPLPAAVIYGMIRNEYGYPYTEGAEVCLIRNGVECDRDSISGLVAAGSNYRLELQLDSGGTLYAPYAAHVGDSITLVVKIGGVEQPLTPSGVLVAGDPASRLRFDCSTAEDLDGDDLPDAWETLMMNQSGGAITNIAQITKTGDLDGDGMSNYDEYRAGTFPFLASDFFEIEDCQILPGGRMRVRFRTKSGLTYHAVVCENINDAGWSVTPFSATETGDFEYSTISGDGDEHTIYLDASVPSAFYRLVVQ